MAGICYFLILGHFAILVICFLSSCMVWHYFLLLTLWKPSTSYSLKSNARAFADSRFLPVQWYAISYPYMCFISCACCQLTSLPPKIWFSSLFFFPTRTEIKFNSLKSAAVNRVLLRAFSKSNDWNDTEPGQKNFQEQMMQTQEFHKFSFWLA